MAQKKIGGTIYLKSNGREMRPRGNFTWNPGHPKREALIGAARVDGYKETQQAASIEGEITIDSDTDVEEIVRGDDLTITLELIDGTVFALYEAWFAGEGTINTEEGNMTCRWEAARAEVIRR